MRGCECDVKLLADNIQSQQSRHLEFLCVHVNTFFSLRLISLQHDCKNSSKKIRVRRTHR